MIAAALAAPLLGQIGSIDARAADPAIPETRAGAQLAWAIDQLNGGYSNLAPDDCAVYWDEGFLFIERALPDGSFASE